MSTIHRAGAAASLGTQALRSIGEGVQRAGPAKARGIHQVFADLAGSRAAGLAKTPPPTAGSVPPPRRPPGTAGAGKAAGALLGRLVEWKVSLGETQGKPIPAAPEMKVMDHAAHKAPQMEAGIGAGKWMSVQDQGKFFREGESGEFKAEGKFFQEAASAGWAKYQDGDDIVRPKVDEAGKKWVEAEDPSLKWKGKIAETEDERVKIGDSALEGKIEPPALDGKGGDIGPFPGLEGQVDAVGRMFARVGEMLEAMRGLMDRPRP
jgi:hypothetical protein